MKKISYIYLQKKFPGKLVVLDKEEKAIVGFGKKFSELFKKLEKKHLSPKKVVIVGPVQKSGTINAYIN